MRRAIFTIILLTLSLSAFAAGPFSVANDNSGRFRAWRSLTWVVEPTDLSDQVSLAVAQTWITGAFEKWVNAVIVDVDGNAHRTANVSIAYGGYIPAKLSDVSDSSPFLDPDASIAFIYFDQDGTMIDEQFGVGASDYVVGYSMPYGGIGEAAGDVVGGMAVFNGMFIDGNSDNAYDISDDGYKAVLLHELGHLLNLDHTQVNFEVADAYENGNDKDIDEIPTMYPILYTEKQSTLHVDDVVAMSMIYPVPAFTSEFCTARGTLVALDGAGFQGANVIARAIDAGAELIDVRSMVSGVHYPANIENGDYELYGLIPGRSYKVYYEKILPGFIDGSGIEPYDQAPRTDFLAAVVSESVACDSPGAVIELGSSEVAPATPEEAASAEALAKGEGDGGGCSLTMVPNASPVAVILFLLPLTFAVIRGTFHRHGNKTP